MCFSPCIVALIIYICYWLWFLVFCCFGTYVFIVHFFFFFPGSFWAHAQVLRRVFRDVRSPGASIINCTNLYIIYIDLCSYLLIVLAPTIKLDVVVYLLLVGCMLMSLLLLDFFFLFLLLSFFFFFLYSFFPGLFWAHAQVLRRVFRDIRSPATSLWGHPGSRGHYYQLWTF